MRIQDVMRKAGIAVVTGAFVLSTVPVAAIAEGTQSGGEPPAMSQSQDDASGQPGEPPSDGEGPGSDGSSAGGEAPSGEAPSGEAPSGQPGEGGGAGGGANTMTFDYSGTYSGALTADGETVSSADESYDASTADQNAALVQNGGTLSITGGTLTKSGDDTNGDNCNFYGVNSVLLSVGEGSTATVSGTSLSATSEGSNAIFATDSGTVYANDVTIHTTAGNSRGLDATYSGTIVASNVDASTEGGHSATVATDRGGGSISVTDSTLSTAGSGSPLLYSTGNIQVSGVTGTAAESQIAAMEGLNTILINNSQLTSTNTDTTGSDPVANGVIIYQSTSGDAESTTGETATFQAADSTLSSAIASGSMFYLTNTSADVVLCRTTLDFDTSAANLLLAAGNDSNNWGSAGSNGATVKFTAIEQELEGTIGADTISKADVYLTDGSTWTGKAVISENANGSTVDEPLTVSIDSTSTWVVTEDCTVSALTVADGGQVVDENGDTVTIVAGGETVVEGTSSITVTVTGAYSTDYDASAAGALSTDVIDRSAFDETFGTDTDWTMGDAATKTAAAETTETEDTSTSEVETTEVAEEEETSSNPFVAFFQWIVSLFGF